MLQPLGHRVLIKPDVQPEASASGLILPENRDHVPVSGQVVALGPGGSLMKFKARQRGIKAALEVLEPIASVDHAKEELRALLNTADPARDVRVGDFVVFPAESGFHVTHEGEPYVLVNEDDIAVLETA